MVKVKDSAVAGTFYDKDTNKLKEQLKAFELNTQREGEYFTRAVILPHAGYEYSGKLAMKGLKYLDKNVKTIFILAPTHSFFVKGMVLPSDDFWQTPLGNVEIDKTITKELSEKFGLGYDDRAFEKEHSLEIQLPLIQTLYSDIKIVPIILGATTCKDVSEIIDYYWANPEVGFIISSDLSHFNSIENCKKIDKFTAEKIERLAVYKIFPEQACGFLGITGLMQFTRQKKFSLIRLGLTNSGEIDSKNGRAVGYGSWMLYEGQFTDYIKNNLSSTVKRVVKSAISDCLNDTVSPLGELPSVLNESGASFVTLKIDGELRGCIGSVVPYRTLLEDLQQNAINSATNDTRFKVLTKEEFEKVDISVSLLSPLERMRFTTEEELLAQIEPNIDGVLIIDGDNDATYLPSVWELIPDKQEFLNSLKQKAGLSRDYFSETLVAHKYKTACIE